MAAKTKIQVILDALGVEKVNRAFKTVGKTMNELGKNHKALSLAIAGSFASISLLAKKAIDNASELESALIGVSTTAAAWGQSADDARMSAERLAKDGLVPVATAASGLRQLLSTGLNLEQANDLMDVFKDRAAFGRRSTISFSQAVDNLASSVMTGNAMIGNASGMAENYTSIEERGAAILGLKTSQVNSTNIAMVRYTGIMARANEVSGNANKFGETYQGQQAKLSQTLFELSATIGGTLTPAMSVFTGQLKAVFSLALGWVKNNQVLVGTITFVTLGVLGLTAAVVALSFAKVKLAGSIVLVRNMFMTLLTTPIGIFFLSLGLLVGVLMARFTQFAKAAQSSFGDVADAAKASFPVIANEAEDAAKKTQDALDEINKSIKEEKRNFVENLLTIVRRHQSAVKALQEDIKKEKNTFMEAQKEKERDFRENMDDMLANHKDGIGDIERDIREEKESFKDAQAEKRESFNNTVQDMTFNHRQKVDAIKFQIQEEQDKGERADEDRVESLKFRLKQENDKFGYAVTTRTDRYEDETKDAKDENDIRVTNLEDHLIEVKDKNKVEVKRANEERKRQTTKDETALGDRMTALEKKLGDEKTFLEKHGKSVVKVRDLQLFDEIEALRREHKKQLKEYEDQKKKVVKETGDMSDANIANTKALDDYIKSLDLAAAGAELGSAFGGAVWGGFIDSITEDFKAIPDGLKWFFSGNLPGRVGVHTPDLTPDWQKFIIDEPDSGTADDFIWRKGQGVQKFSPDDNVVGFKGDSPSGMGGGATFNANVYVGMYAGTALEKRRIAEELMDEFRFMARAKGRSVVEEISVGK